MKRQIGIIGIGAFLLMMMIQACNEQKSTESAPEIPVMSEGFHLLNQNCFSCHNPDAEATHTAAPGMFEIAAIYKDKASDFSEFNMLLSRFLKSPSPENSQMPEALEKYALMPSMSYSDEQYNAIAAYLYFSEIDKPEWYKAQFEAEKNKYASGTENLSPMETGRQLAMQTKAILGKNLMSAINTKGTAEALAFCSGKAFGLTDSMAQALNADIKRVSDKNRNPLNAADSAQTAYIEECRMQLSNGKKPVPMIQELKEKYLAYYPIMTEEMCLQCHGVPEKDIKSETLAKIKEQYPEDKAIGYSAGQIRGAWVIAWDIKK